MYADRYSVQGLATENQTVELYANWLDSSVTLPTPTRDGYTFVAWYSDPSLANNYRVGPGGYSYTPPANITLYAKWEETTYNNISFTWGTGYSVTQEPPATAKMSDTFTVKLKLDANKYNCEPVLTINTGTATLKPYNAGVLIREYEITGVTEDFSISIGDAVPPTYTVTFIDGLSGETIEAQTGLSLGATIQAPSVDDYVVYTDGQHLKFTGWDGAFSPVNGNLTVNSVYVAENHTWDDGTILTQNYSCTDTVDTEYRCVWCPQTKIETAPAGNHSFLRRARSETTLKSAATCQSLAEYYYSCEHCDAVEYDDSHTFTYGDYAAHDYSAATVKDAALKSAANCTDAAVYYYSCAVCGAVENNANHTFTSGEANGHAYEWIVDKAANCGETGIKHEECGVCHAKRSEGTVIPTQGEHQFSWIEDQAATCVESGVQHEECGVCHAKRSEGSVIEPTGAHTLSKTDAVPVTCTDDGSIAYWTCSVCSQKFSDQNGRNAVTDEQIVITHPGHEFSAEKTESKYLKSAANCTDAAVYYRSCVRCGEKGTETFTSGEPNGHSFYWVEDRAATCVEPGVKHEKCRNCTATRNESTRIEPTGRHTYTAKTEKTEAKKSDATCTAGAVYYYSCAVCGAVEGSASHTFTVGGGLGHSFGEWTQDRAPTCSAEGSESRTCARCGRVENRSVAKTAHVDANGDYSCDACGADMTPGDLCPYCHQTHDGAFGWLIRFFHMIAYFFSNLFN